MSNEGLKDTQINFNWLIKNQHAEVDLYQLAKDIEELLNVKRDRSEPDGIICNKCMNFYHFAEPNQPDGSLICYSCRTRS